MNLDEMVGFLKKSTLRSIEGDHSIDGKIYHVKAYKIGDPHNLIRLDVKEFSKEEIQNARDRA